MINHALRLIRIFHNLKSKELAKKLAISDSYISEIENGKKQPTLDLLQRYSKTFNIPLSSILFFSETLETKDIKNKDIKLKARSLMLKFLLALEKTKEKISK